METQDQQFQIFLPGLLEVLAENLYSDNRVAIRELLQNAHDSCIRRTVEGRAGEYKPRIDVSVDAETHVLTIRDNGSGLTREEIQNYLSTIGRSYTRQLGEDLAVLAPDKAEQLIGQFGLGFLSAFFIASDVTVITQSMREGHETLAWYSVGDGHYGLTVGEKAAVGTTIKLKLKTNAFTLADTTILKDTIRKYADFLPMPIYVEGQTLPVNRMRPPWEEPNPEKAISGYIADVFDIQNPICVIRLTNHVIELGHDSLTIPLEGFLFIPSLTVISVREYGDMLIYIRRMFIGEDTNDLLPSWARFIRGVIDSPYLQPTASREQIQQNENFQLVKLAIGQQLTNALRRIATREKPLWHMIVQGHRNVILPWAAKDDEFFKEVADIVTFKTSRGNLTLPDYLKLSDGTIYYTTRRVGSLQDQVISESLSKPVIDALYVGESSFLNKYAEVHHLRISLIDENLSRFFMDVSDSETALWSLAALFYKAGVRVKVVLFHPSEIPAIITYPDRLQFYEDTRNAVDTGGLPTPFADMIETYLDELINGETINGQIIEATLCLNASNPLIQRLAAHTDDVVREAGLLLIYQTACLFNGRLLNVTKVHQIFQNITSTLTTLIEQGKE